MLLFHVAETEPETQNPLLVLLVSDGEVGFYFFLSVPFCLLMIGIDLDL